MRTFGMLRSVEWKFRTDVSGQPFDPFLKGEEFLATELPH